MEKSKYLDCVLESYKMRKEQELVDKHISKRNEIKEFIEGEFKEKIYTPFNSGSYAKHTAINIKFDFDIVIPFKRNAFATLEEMYNDAYNLLEKKYKGIATIRKQKVSIGLEFIDGDHIVLIDVTPGRELNQNQYLVDNKLNLFVFSQFGIFEKGNTSIRTNIKAQIDNIRRNGDRDSIRQNIRLLKGWKVNHRKTPKSFFLELIVIRAFDDAKIEGNRWEQIKSVIEFIRNNVKSINLTDPGNSGNNVADTLSSIEKSLLSDDMNYILEQIESNDEMIKYYFKTNDKHPCQEENVAVYGVKKEAVSIPPTKRFG